MYAFFLVAGALALVFPPQSIESALISVLVYAWAGFLFLGGLISFIGVVRDSIAGENIGIPLLSSANAIFGTALFSYGVSSAATAIGCVFWGIAFGLLPRWFEVRYHLRVAMSIPEEEGNGDE
jgi:hypothetical protein